MVDYIIRAALAEETNDGWVWICGPSQNLDSRTVVKLKRPGCCWGVYTELRTIDCNFLQRYNDNPRTHKIDCKRDTIVMAEWYRRALAIPGSTSESNEIGRVSLIVKKMRIPIWRTLRAACHHADPVVRLGTRLGMLGAWLGGWGVWLGGVGVWLGLRSASAMPCIALSSGFAALVLFSILGVWAGWGPPRPRLT